MSLRYRGAWNAATAYSVDDTVAYHRSTYKRLIAGTTGTTPAVDTTNWHPLFTWAGTSLLSTGGASGPAGGVLSGTYPDPAFAPDAWTVDTAGNGWSVDTGGAGWGVASSGGNQDITTDGGDVTVDTNGGAYEVDSVSGGIILDVGSTGSLAAQSTAGDGVFFDAGASTIDVYADHVNFHSADITGTPGGAPSGAAGGDLAGSYPNPTIKTALNDPAAATPGLRTLGTGAAQAAAGNDSRLSDARAPTTHATTHQPGGSDAMAVDAAAATGSLRTLGTGAAQAAAGNDSRLSDARTPTAHKTSHATGGSDAIAPSDIGAAPLASPSLTGNPLAPTPSVDDNDTSIATTAYVIGQASASGDGTPAMDGTAARGTGIHWARADHVHPTDTSRAALASPTFTGTPAAPTASAGTNTTQLASTAYAHTEMANLAATYQPLKDQSGRMTSGAVNGTKYWCSGGNDISALGVGSAVSPYFLLTAADLAVAGLTTKLRVVMVVHTATAPAVTITGGLYPVTAGASDTLGTVVSGSTVAIVTPSANSDTTGNSGDFTLPSDGVFALGYTPNGTPAAAATVIQLTLQVRHV